MGASGHAKSLFVEIASAAEIKSYYAKAELVQLCSEVGLGSRPPLDGSEAGVSAVMSPAEHIRILNKNTGDEE